VENAHTTAWGTFSLPGFLRPQCDKLLPELIFLQAEHEKI